MRRWFLFILSRVHTKSWSYHYEATLEAAIRLAHIHDQIHKLLSTPAKYVDIDHNLHLLIACRLLFTLMQEPATCYGLHPTPKLYPYRQLSRIQCLFMQTDMQVDEPTDSV